MHKVTVDLHLSLKTTVEFEFAPSWCTCSVRLGEDTCVSSVAACLSAAATLLVITHTHTHTQQISTLCSTWCV